MQGRRFRQLGVGLLALSFEMISPRPVLADRRVESFNRDWRFTKGAQRGAETSAFDDAAWERVRLPHDWAIAGPYDPAGDPHTGKLPWKGEGWYRKHFTLPASDAGKRVLLEFDGVMAMPSVFVNGRAVGGWDYGYASFRVNATEAMRFGDSNVVSVHVDTRGHSSRWYPGAGIYRNVRLLVQDPVHVAEHGVFVTTPVVTKERATARVATTLENFRPENVTLTLVTTVRAPNGAVVGTRRQPVALPARQGRETAEELVIERPRLWDLGSPNLYTVDARVLEGERVLDTVQTTFGIRTAEFTADDGFHLNGRRVELRGVCLHHDLGPLGAAFNVRAMERELSIMKEMGANAIRTSHNPPAPELLDLTDRMGFFVWDEAFDKWDGTATLPPGVSIPTHGKKQIQAMVRRDRNHPSVVVWSVGNEVWDLENGKIPKGPELLRQLVGFAKEADPTRPVTLAHAVANSATTPLDDSLDVGGWNYGRRYATSRERRPKLPLVYSESASAYSTRGFYDFPQPTQKDDYSLALRISSYDRNAAHYSDIADTEFALMEQDRYVAGEFVWTGFDYLGEPVPFVSEGWGSFKPRRITRVEEGRSSSFGIVNLVGIPKDRYFLYRSHWAPEKRTIHVVPHWTFPDRVGKPVPVYVYTNGDSAELFLDGKSLGRRAKSAAGDVLDRYRLRWEDVTYAPGTLRVVAYQGKQKLGETTVKTAGSPVRLRLTPDRSALSANGDDLSYVLVEAVDKDGNLCPNAMDSVRFALSGPATIAGVGNGDHRFPAEFDTDEVALFYGKAMLIVRGSEGDGGAIGIVASSPGLKNGSARLRARPVGKW